MRHPIPRKDRILLRFLCLCWRWLGAEANYYFCNYVYDHVTRILKETEREYADG